MISAAMEANTFPIHPAMPSQGHPQHSLDLHQECPFHTTQAEAGSPLNISTSTAPQSSFGPVVADHRAISDEQRLFSANPYPAPQSLGSNVPPVLRSSVNVGPSSTHISTNTKPSLTGIFDQVKTNIGKTSINFKRSLENIKHRFTKPGSPLTSSDSSVAISPGSSSTSVIRDSQTELNPQIPLKVFPPGYEADMGPPLHIAEAMRNQEEKTELALESSKSSERSALVPNDIKPIQLSLPRLSANQSSQEDTRVAPPRVHSKIYTTPYEMYVRPSSLDHDTTSPLVTTTSGNPPTPSPDLQTSPITTPTTPPSPSPSNLKPLHPNLLPPKNRLNPHNAISPIIPQNPQQQQETQPLLQRQRVFVNPCPCRPCRRLGVGIFMVLGRYRRGIWRGRGILWGFGGKRRSHQ
ncbi:hypothetical protein BC829DRAFT_398408 [Chytridium lagenaria]|nr:hypothetical protein BC829DRAFT_398408 [Chytridium lagenaria]